MHNLSLENFQEAAMKPSPAAGTTLRQEPEKGDLRDQPGHLVFFGLADEPFQLTPNRNFFFRSAVHTSVLEVVRYGIREGEGFIIVVGEVGTGKTLLLRMLMPEFKGRYETALILSPLLSPQELLQAILVDIGRDPGDNNNIEYLLRELNTYLFELAKSHKKLAIIIDEAQNLPDETIEQLRLLSNFESDRQKWLQIVLVGQPELRSRLNQPNLRQLLQRITIMETLRPLAAREMMEYVRFRMGQAGRGDINLSWWARRYLWKKTRGVPRQINRLMGRALLVAYARHSSLFTLSILKNANDSLTLEQSRSSAARKALHWALASLACLTTLCLLYYFRQDILKTFTISTLFPF